MKRLSAVFSARMGAVLASAALLSGCVVMPVEGGYRHHDRYEHYESHDRYDRYEGHHRPLIGSRMRLPSTCLYSPLLKSLAEP